MAVEEEAKVVLEARQHEVLVARIAGKNDVVGVDVVFGSHGNAARISNSDGQPHDDERAGHAKRALAGELVGEQIRAPERDAGVDQAKEHGGADEAKPRNKKNRKKQRRAERAEVIERKNMRDDVAEFVAVAHDAHEQRNLETDEHAHHYDQRVENQLEALRERKGKHQQRGRTPASHAEPQFSPREPLNELAIEIAREGAADAHGEEVGADD